MKAAAAAAISVILASAPVMALPRASITGRDESEATEWRSESGTGNIEAAYGDTKMNFGSLDPVKALEAIVDDCSTEIACKPNTIFTRESVFVVGGGGDDREITIDVEGHFNGRDKDGDRAHLVELAKTVLGGLVEKEVATKEEDVKYLTGECPPSRTHGCLTQEAHYTDQWTSTDHVVVRYTDDDGTQYHLNVGFGVQSTGGGAGAGMCGSILSVGGAVAGAVSSFSGPLGVIGSLLSLGCGQIDG